MDQEQADRIEAKLDEVLEFKAMLMTLLGKFGGKYMRAVTK